MKYPDAKFHENCFDGFHFRWISIFPVPETRAPGQDLFPQFKAPKNANRILKLSIYTNLSLVKTKINLFCLKYYLQNLPPGGHLLISSIVFKWSPVHDFIYSNIPRIIQYYSTLLIIDRHIIFRQIYYQ